jgi:hypothetical protein
LALVLAQLGGRLAYYGDPVPNTYYAKSANQAWYEQGWSYLRLYFAKYPVLAAAAPAMSALLAIDRGRRRARSPRQEAWRDEGLLALLLALVQTLFVLRVGGDFMFARLLIPATPFYLILTELALGRLLPVRGDMALAAGAAVVFAVWLAPHPLWSGRTVDGIVDERLEYPSERRDTLRRKGETLRRFFAGLPVRVAFMGSEARVVYYSEVPVAIECAAGLTDRFIARRPLEHRGRVGHEKRPTSAYLLGERGVQLGLHAGLASELALGDSALAMPIRFANARACVLRWDEALMAELRRRGARFAEEPVVSDSTHRMRLGYNGHRSA